MASWPSETSSILAEEDNSVGPDQSTFSLLHVMMKQAYIPGETRHGTVQSTYAHESIEFNINLTKGRELIPLGVATLVITGDDEEEEVVINLPAKPVGLLGHKRKVVVADDKKKRRPATPTRIFKPKVKRAAFASDPDRKFNLDENATLRVAVQVIPHGVIKETEAAAARKGKTPKDGMENSLHASTKEADKRAKMMAFLAETRLQTTPKPVKVVTSPASDHRTGFFCGALCAPPQDIMKPMSTRHDEKAKLNLSDVRTEAMDDYMRHEFGMSSSVVSSVSGSESSESESDWSSDEDKLVHINRRVVIRRRDG